MMKHRVVGLLIAVAGLIGGAAAQSSQGLSSSASAPPSRDPLQTATKPLTPKSSMPTKRKSSVVVGAGATGGRNTTAELTRLERQNVKAGGSKGSSTEPAKVASGAKANNLSDASDSKINFKYQKPVGGSKASTPQANSANSATPRVKKN